MCVYLRVYTYIYLYIDIYVQSIARCMYVYIYMNLRVEIIYTHTAFLLSPMFFAVHDADTGIKPKNVRFRARLHLSHRLSGS